MWLFCAFNDGEIRTVDSLLTHTTRECKGVCVLRELFQSHEPLGVPGILWIGEYGLRDVWS